MDTPAKGVPVAPKTTEEIEFRVFEYASKERKATGYGLRTIEGVKAFGEIKNAPKSIGVLVEQTKPGNFSAGRFGDGWSVLLRSIPEDTLFAIKLRKALELQVQHTCVWDADLQKPVMMTVADALKQSIPVTGPKAAGIRV